jgi:hypothetical protein
LRTFGSQLRLRAIAPLVVAGTLALAAATAAGLQPSPVRPIPDSAFVPVLVDREAAALSAPTAAPAPTPDLRPLADPQVPVTPAARPKPALPDPKAIVVEVPPPAPELQRTGHSIRGRASWYCNYDDPSVPRSACHYAYPDGPGFDAYAAAGPGLRNAIGPGWRNNVVQVCGRRCVNVKLVDWCKCNGGSVGVVKLIDLYEDVYSRTGGNVTISW